LIEKIGRAAACHLSATVRSAGYRNIDGNIGCGIDRNLDAG
jgi:hypothetical protein